MLLFRTTCSSPPPPCLFGHLEARGRVCHEHGSRLRREVVIVAVVVRYSGVTTLNPLTRRVPRLNINHRCVAAHDGHDTFRRLSLSLSLSLFLSSRSFEIFNPSPSTSPIPPATYACWYTIVPARCSCQQTEKVNIARRSTKGRRRSKVPVGKQSAWSVLPARIFLVIIRNLCQL